MKYPIKDKKFVFLLITIIIVLSLEILSILGIHIPMPYAPLVFAIFILSVGFNVLRNGFMAIFKLKFSSINLLMTIAVIGAFYLGEYPEAAVVIVLYVLGERLEDIGIENSKSALVNLINKIPKTAFVKDSSENVKLDKIEIGTIIQVKPGEIIPLDGVITFGETSIDEATITGEPIPKYKSIGDNIFAGTLNTNGFIEIKTTKLFNDTTFSKIIKLTFEAQGNKSDTQKFIQKFSSFYTPTIIVLAISVFIIPVFVLQLDFNHWLQQSITLLVIACPCALVISTPVAIYAAIGNASSKGVLIKGGKYLEALAYTKAIALDKTRTITMGTPIVSDVFPLNGVGRKDLLACTAGVEVFSEHPLAQAIVNLCKNEEVIPHQTEKFISIMGKGASAKCLQCENNTIYVGKPEFVQEYMVFDQSVKNIIEQLSSQGKTSVVVGFSNRNSVVGVIGLMDEIKTDSATAISDLLNMNIEVVMLTGDSVNAANFVAKKVGINKIFGNMLPENKSDKIQDLLEQYNYVAMVGDGINDAPALAKSTIGIAMGSAGSDTAIETANIALMNDKLSLIPFLIRLSKKTINRIKFNTISAIAVKLLFITLAFFGFSNLVFAIAADVGVTLIVILTSLNLMKFK